MNVNIKRLSPDAIIPQYAHATDAGFDLVATEDIIVEPGETVRVPTGLAFEIPAGFELQIRPRSGITLWTKLRVQLGTVDSGFTGEVGVIADNISLPEYEIEEEDFGRLAIEIPRFNGLDTIDGAGTLTEDGVPEGTYLIRKHDRIAQGVIAPIVQATFNEVETLGETDRGAGGFGSTGTLAEREALFSAYLKEKEDE